MKAEPSPRTILLAGPTASGKSALALALAERLGGVVINADSMQVYRELRILTARPSAADEQRLPHRLYGHVPGAEPYSAGRYAVEARAAIGAAHMAGRAAIVVGGTGLYFRALTDGLSPIPPVPDDIRAHWRAKAMRIGAAALHAELVRRDPLMGARLRDTDPQRVTRALEVLDATGCSLAEWQAMPGLPVVAGDAARLVLAPDRETLKRRCDERFERMLEEGAVEEVRALLALGLDAELPVMRALGVAPIAGLVTGKASREAASDRGKVETRQYAKRQLTWLRSNMRAWKWLLAQETQIQADEVMAFIYS